MRIFIKILLVFLDIQKQLEELMAKISQQDYDYKEMKDTLSGIKETINDKLDELEELSSS